ncbi:tRNA (adenosine(37)-N6)-dimethylallyltransferase MiaA [Parerythrobacter aestuarii]|uniref:tRNA (adenosine(37)-N6)-dimethylallyltransferase MiaA n=1 Tax=Parerythrobacter aestuarii TaxID=3020909 RepID=UPI0024DDFEC8|nr:tRNA (adenosine(37)-N6)-dimethylallyltransferase MiaA [Parerythrobacter aestuarii]
MSKEDSPIGGPLALIAGPTASGKSDVAVQLALALKDRGREAVVLNADSQQVYADLRIVSARPCPEDMSGIEHRLFGTWDGGVACSTADWADAAKREIGQLHAKGAVPILCGGTGLYMRTLLEGIAPIPDIDTNVRSAVRKLATRELRTCLVEEDPVAAERLNANDSQRMARALEVVRSTGTPLHVWQRRTLVGGIGDLVDLHPLILLPERDWLFERCDRRFELMMQHGGVEEVAQLLERNLDPALPVMRAIGVPEIAAFVQGVDAVEDAIAAGQQATRNYAKRQYTWFRNQPPADWARVDEANFNLEDVFEGLFQN